MIRLVLALLLALAPAARAEVLRVTSGEHDGYSRLLVTATAAQQGWRLNRTADGYALAAGAGTTGFDLSRAFDRIPRTRVTALFTDPADGRLRIRVGCACHAIAFLHEGRHLVVDIRDGAAPARSAFELADDGTRPPPLPGQGLAVARRDDRPRYDWLAARRDGAAPANDAAGLPARRMLPAPAQDDLRRALLAGIARGASAGVIGLTLPADAPVAMPPGLALFNGGAPGITVDTDPGDPRATAEAGPECPATSRFDIGAWATAEPFVLQFGHHRAALLGEFDRPDPAAVDAAIRFHLHLGFGAEAADLMRAFPDATADRQVLSLMAAILEGQMPGDPDTRHWMGCDTAAALWATLAQPAEAAGTANRQALRQAFGTLPAHLRALLAPRLRERALLLDDAELDASVEAAALRGTGGPGTGAGNGSPGPDAPPAALLATWRDGGGDAVPAALAYVAAAHAAGQPVPAEVPGALLALAQEYDGLPEADALARAGRLAAALAGDHETALADPARAADMPELWRLLVETADDDTFIALSIARRDLFPGGHPDLAAAIAARLLDLRLPELALGWLPPAPADGRAIQPPGPAADPSAAMTAAAALIDLGRGREALARLDGLPPTETAALRAEAADLAGEHRLAAEAWAIAGDADRAARSARLAGDPGQPAAASAWERLQQDVTGAPRPRTAEGVGPLNSATALVAASADLRADIDALLSDTALPAGE